jgi:hypothetical protein
VIEALPAIVDRHPDPDICNRRADSPPTWLVARVKRYRLSLERAVLDLGLEDHVEFDDRFLSVDEIADLLAATDVFVTPYRRLEQISSGALTFGLAAGCRGVVSTPLLVRAGHALVGRGHTGAVRRSGAVAAAVCRYIEEPESPPLRVAAGQADRRAACPCAVASATAEVIREGGRARTAQAQVGRRARPAARRMRTDHLLTLVDDVGIVQHANGVIPNRQAATASTTWHGSQSSRSGWRVVTSRSGRRSSTRSPRSCRTRRSPSGR